MIKTLTNLLRQDKEKYKVPRRVRDVIPIRRIWNDGIFLVGSKYSKTYRFSDINYLVASREDKEVMFLSYSELLNRRSISAALSSRSSCPCRTTQGMSTARNITGCFWTRPPVPTD